MGPDGHTPGTTDSTSRRADVPFAKCSYKPAGRWNLFLCSFYCVNIYRGAKITRPLFWGGEEGAACFGTLSQKTLQRILANWFTVEGRLSRYILRGRDVLLSNSFQRIGRSLYKERQDGRRETQSSDRFPSSLSVY